MPVQQHIRCFNVACPGVNPRSIRIMARFLFWILLLSIAPFTKAQLNTFAVAAGKKYFGTATDNPELSDSAYVAQLSNTSDFNQITPVRFSPSFTLTERIIGYSRQTV